MGQTKNASNVELNCGFPTPQNPFYNLKVTFNLEQGLRYQIKQVRINGERVRDFITYHNHSFKKDCWVEGGGLSEVVIRWDWKCGEEIAVDIEGERPDGNDNLSINFRRQAPLYNGYWDPLWKYYASIVCTETAGIPRVDEPVHVSLALYSDRILNPEKELRIVSVDPCSGVHTEIPSQVYEVSRYTCEEPGERYQPTTTFEVAFFTDLPADSSRIYLAFYGNSEAADPQYTGSLRVEGEGLGLTMENQFYKVLLAKSSGVIDEIHMKMGVNQKFAHHLETNGALHWNPGIYAPPRQWLHASDWNPPQNHTFTYGPIFAMTKLSGPLDHYPESHISITYRFYEKLPWILMSSRIEIKRDLAVKALRNGEIVLNRELVDEFAWRKPDGNADSMVIEEGPRHPAHAKVLPYDTPWVCFFNRKHQCGLGMVTAKLANFRKDGGLCKTFNRYSYLQWGPWVYYARPLVYTFASNNPGRLVNVPAGNIYYEEMAFVPIKIKPENENFQELERLHTQLSHPIDIRLVEDTDPRAPEGWMPPVLVEEFEEM